MALRLSDTEEWNSHFVRGLKGPYRAFWFWLKSACNHAGIWEIDIDVARMRTGFMELDQAEAELVFSSKIIKLECGEKWFIFSFCEDQYKTTLLNPANTAHRGVIRILQKLNLIDLNFNILRIQTKPLQSSLLATKVLDVALPPIELETILLKTREKKIKVPKEIITKDVPKSYVTPYTEAFKDFKDMRVKKRNPLTERAAAMIHTELTKLAGDNEDLKIAILNQSTKNGWADVWPLKTKDSQIEPSTKGQNINAMAAKVTYKGSDRV